MGDNPELCAKTCKDFVPKGVETLEVNEDNGDHKCTFYDENDCRFEFVYNDNDIDKINVTAKEKLECPTEIFVLGIVLGVIASIVLIGLALLFVWKLLTTIHDRREFAKFEKERRAAKWDTVSQTDRTEPRTIYLTFVFLLSSRVRIQYTNKQRQRLRIQRTVAADRHAKSNEETTKIFFLIY